MVYYIWIRSLDILLFIRVVTMNISLDEPFLLRIFCVGGYDIMLLYLPHVQTRTIAVNSAVWYLYLLHLPPLF